MLFLYCGKLLGCLAPEATAESSFPLLLHIGSPGSRGTASRTKTQTRGTGPGRTMLRGKSRLNVGWLGYSPGLLLEKDTLAEARTPRSTRGNENSLASTLKTLLFFTALMITVPIGLYFTTKSYVFEGALGMSNRDSYFYAAIVAVVAVHVVLALFVYVAWNEGSRQWREGKQD